MGPYQGNLSKFIVSNKEDAGGTRGATVQIGEATKLIVNREMAFKHEEELENEGKDVIRRALEKALTAKLPFWGASGVKFEIDRNIVSGQAAIIVLRKRHADNQKPTVIATQIST